MKLLTVTAVKEYSKDVATIFKKAGIHVFSVTDIVGFKEGVDENMMDSWFGRSDPRFDSVFLFSFTADEKATTALQLIREYNQQHPGDFPLRGFTLTVDNSTN